ncbi:hypothetical protein AB0O91_39955 [Kitasatospora sp. NPDC089797]
MDIIVSGLVAVGRALWTVLSWANIVEGQRILYQEFKKIREK